jgi:hypothetical protein
VQGVPQHHDAGRVTPQYEFNNALVFEQRAHAINRNRQ